MLALFAVLVVILVICVACASVTVPPRHYPTCKVFKVQPVVEETGRKLWVAKCLQGNSAMWMKFHREVKEGWVVEYVTYEEEGDPMPHAQVHALYAVERSNDTP